MNTFSSVKDTVKTMRTQDRDRRKYSQVTHLVKDSYPKYGRAVTQLLRKQPVHLKGLNRHSSKDSQAAKQPRRRGSSTAQAAKESRIQTTAGNLHTPKGHDVDTDVGEGGAGRTSTHCRWERNTEQPLWEKVWCFLQSQTHSYHMNPNHARWNLPRL